jgi:hypothetical protein
MPSFVVHLTKELVTNLELHQDDQTNNSSDTDLKAVQFSYHLPVMTMSMDTSSIDEANQVDSTLFEGEKPLYHQEEK